MSWDENIKNIKKREKLALQQGGKKAVEKQHNKGRKTLRERLEFILVWEILECLRVRILNTFIIREDIHFLIKGK